MVGINSQIAPQSGGNEGIGYAVPIESAKSVADALIAGKTVERAVPRRQPRRRRQRRAIARSRAAAAADEAGLKAGDVVTKAGGDEVRRATTSAAQWPQQQPGDQLS